MNGSSILYGKLAFTGECRLGYTQLAIVCYSQQPVGICTTDDKIPISAVVLHEVLMRDSGSFDLLVQPIRVNDLFHHLAILHFLEIFTLAGHCHLHRFILTLHNEYRCFLFHFYAMPDDNAFENGFFITAITCFDLYLLTRFKLCLITYLK